MIHTTVRLLSLAAAAALLASPALAQQAQQPAKPAAGSSAKPAPAQAAKPAPAQAAKPKPAQAAKPKPPEAKPSQTASANAQAAVTPGQPTLLGQFGDWGAYTASPAGKKICFVIAKPASAQTNPPGRPRDQPYFFISTRPSEKVKEEISTVVGYALKADTANAVIGSANFAMYAQNDGAWIKNAAEEARMIDAMRKSGELVVKGTSGRGTETTDTYSLRGLSQALDRAGQECR
jgi:hypothetical protein